MLLLSIKTWRSFGGVPLSGDVRNIGGCTTASATEPCWQPRKRSCHLSRRKRISLEDLRRSVVRNAAASPNYNRLRRAGTDRRGLSIMMRQTLHVHYQTGAAYLKGLSSRTGWVGQERLSMEWKPGKCAVDPASNASYYFNVSERR